MVYNYIDTLRDSCIDFYNKKYITDNIFLFILDFNNLLHNKAFGKIKYTIKKYIFEYITSENHKDKEYYFASFVFYYLTYVINKNIPKNKKIKDKKLRDKIYEIYNNDGLYSLYKVKDAFTLEYIKSNTSVWFYSVYEKLMECSCDIVLSLFLYYVFIT